MFERARVSLCSDWNLMCHFEFHKLREHLFWLISIFPTRHVFLIVCFVVLFFIHCVSVKRTVASGPPYYSALIVYVPKVSGGLAVWRFIWPKPKPSTSSARQDCDKEALKAISGAVLPPRVDTNAFDDRDLDDARTYKTIDTTCTDCSPGKKRSGLLHLAQEARRQRLNIGSGDFFSFKALVGRHGFAYIC